MNLKEKLKDKLQLLPEKSGVYLMRDASGHIIYIGKAVILKNRVRQYFNNSQKPEKVQAMVDNIADFDYIITLSEKDALALEANLVKKHKPHYNILLKDDRSSPYIRIDTREDFPTIEVTRKLRRDGARYFGPYFNGIYVWDVVSIIRSAYQMRTCPKKFRGKERVCLNYHIQLCKGPCCGKITKEEYAGVVGKVIAFLSGKDDQAEKLLIERMNLASEQEEFERAIHYRDQILMLQNLKDRNVAHLGRVLDIDCFYYVSNGEYSVCSVNIIRAGKMMGVKDFLLTGMSFTLHEDLTSFIVQYYGNNNEVPAEICLQETFDTTALQEYLLTLAGKNIHITVPQKGSKVKLLDMAKVNAEDYLGRAAEKYRREYNNTYGATSRLCKVLGLESVRRMECYDISNISGTDKVASQVVFIDGAPAKSYYRRYKIKTVEGSDDFASLKEVLARRMERHKQGDEKFGELPDLIVIDGGKGQLSSAYAAVQESGIAVNMISVAKKNEEIYTVGAHQPIVLSKNDLALKLIQRIRDESHRFAITYHRSLRSKRMSSELSKIKGVGERKRMILLEAFENYNDIKTADVQTLQRIKGIDRTSAENIYQYFRSKEHEV